VVAATKKKSSSRATGKPRGKYKGAVFKPHSPELKQAVRAAALDELAGAELGDKSRAALLEVVAERLGQVESQAEEVRRWQAEIKKHAATAMKAAAELRKLGVPLPDEMEAALGRRAAIKPLPSSRPLLTVPEPSLLKQHDPAAHLTAMQLTRRRALESLLMGNWPNKEGLVTVRGVIRAEKDSIEASSRKRPK
jgi:hypothetical protein